jgi:hypothetical protein
MTIYSGNNYRKVYEQFHGPIPADSDGRTYEIHHIDGDRTNNHLSNLKAVSIQEHYDIHHSQGDWGACVRIGAKMKLSPDQLSAIVRANNLEMVKNGTHPWLGSDFARKRNKKLTTIKTAVKLIMFF